jgi:fructuronate reductase
MSAATAGRPDLPVLSRSLGLGRAAAPVRHVHLGLGNFFRAHQAVYTEQAPDADAWGIAAFTGRSRDLAEQMTSQDGLYTLLIQGPDGDRYDVVGSVSEALAGTDHDSWLARLGSADTGVLSLTVTEAAYCRRDGGGLDHDDPRVTSDVESLRREHGPPPVTVPGRVVAGLEQRRRTDAGPLTVVPCDNLAGNGPAVARVVTELAERVDASLAAWVNESVSFATTVVDRITPRATEAAAASVQEHLGVRDLCPVVTEPFTEWVLSGAFPAGRPRWDQAGALFVDDVTAFEQRKLWLLNGGHSLLAYAGSIRGHTTVFEAVADDTCRDWLEQWWDEASAHLLLPADEVAGYRDALVERFANPAIRHPLAQIAADGSQKLPVRVLPILSLERAQGRVPLGATRTLAAWVLHLRGMGAPVTDAQREDLVACADGTMQEAIRRALGFLDPKLCSDEVVTAAVLAQAEELARS